MEKNKKDLLELLEKDMFQIIGKCKNEFGEEFIVYRLTDETLNHLIYVTGSEVDWEMGWHYTGGNLCKFFGLSLEEDREIKKVIKKENLK